jgi:hypothetical protein
MRIGSDEILSLLLEIEAFSTNVMTLKGKLRTMEALNTPKRSMTAAVEYIAPSAVEILASLGKCSVFPK